MPFTAIPETARRAVLDQGSVTIGDVIDDYAIAIGGPPAQARLNQAQNGIRQAAQATLEAEWPTINDFENNLSTHWSHHMTHAVYVFGATSHDLESFAGDQLVRANEIVALSAAHVPTRQAAAAAITALRARQQGHPEDPADPANAGAAGD